MEYNCYIKLGFKRIDINDAVEFQQTGYYGFILSYQISNRISIEVCSGELDKPKLYIRKQGKETFHIILIDGEVVKDLLAKEVTYTAPFTTAA